MTKPLIGIVLVLLAAIHGSALAQPPTDLEDYAVFGEQKVVFGTWVEPHDGAVGSNGAVKIGPSSHIPSVSAVVADSLRLGRSSSVDGDAYFNTLYLGTDAQVASPHPGITLPILTLPPPVPVLGTGNDVLVEDGESLTLAPGAYGRVDVRGGGRLVLQPGAYEMYGLELRPPRSSLFCDDEDNGGECLVRVLSKLRLRAQYIGYRTPSFPGFGRIVVEFAGTSGVTVGGGDWGPRIRMTLLAPLAKINLKTKDQSPALFLGRLAGRQVKVGSGARISAGLSCGDGVISDGGVLFEHCDGTNANLCPGQCRSDCVCDIDQRRGGSGPEPAFSASCTPGSPGCCAGLRSPLNASGITVPQQHLAVTTKDAIRAVLTPPLAVPGTGHGAALGLSADDLNALDVVGDWQPRFPSAKGRPCC